MADNGEILENTEYAETGDVEGEEVEFMEGAGGENVELEGDVSGEGQFIDGDEDVGDEELVGDGADDDDEAVDLEDGVNTIIWVEELWNRKKAEEATGDTGKKEDPAADDDVDMKEESEERMDSSLKEQMSDVDQPPADLNMSSKSETGAEQPFPGTLLPSVKNISSIPRAFFGPAFDKNCFQSYIRVAPVTYQSIIAEKIQSVLKSADSVRVKVGSKGTSRALELYCQKTTPLLHTLIFTPLGGNKTDFKVERRRVKGWTKVPHKGKMIQVPTGFNTNEAPQRVTFSLKYHYFRKHLDRPLALNANQDVKDRSLFVSNLPARSDIAKTLESVFPLALNIDVIKVSEHQRSAVLKMKNKRVVFDHLVSVQDLFIDGQKVEMGSTSITQLDAVNQAREEEMGPRQKKRDREGKEEDKLKREQRDREQRGKMQSHREEKQKERARERSRQRSGDKMGLVRQRAAAQRESSGRGGVRTGFKRPQRAERRQGRGQGRPSGGSRRQPEMPLGLLTQREINMQREFAVQKEMQMQREMEMQREIQLHREREMQREWDVTRQEKRGQRGRKRFEFGDVGGHQTGGFRKEEEWALRQQSGLLREKERLERVHQDAVHKLRTVQKQQQGNKSRHQHHEEDRTWHQRDTDQWDRHSGKQGRFKPGARSQQQHHTPGKRGRGEEEPWGHFSVGADWQGGQGSESIAPGSSDDASSKRKLELEVARQAEELKKSLALLDKFKSDAAGVSTSLTEVRRAQDTSHEGPSPSFNRQQQPSAGFGTQQQQAYGEGFGEAAYGGNQGQDYRGQYYDGRGDTYGEDLSQFQHPHGGDQKKGAASGYNSGYWPQDSGGQQSSAEWGSGATETRSWPASGSQGAGGYSQPQAYHQTTYYDHGAQHNAGSYQHGESQGGYSDRKYGQAGNPGGYDQAGNTGRGGYGQAGKTGTGGYGQTGKTGTGGYGQTGKTGTGGYGQTGKTGTGGYGQAGKTGAGGYGQAGKTGTDGYGQAGNQRGGRGRAKQRGRGNRHTSHKQW
ncbi:hypothetical protein ACOMHN_054271 [Nucella lapillus]